jgi:hypothetical protein
VFKPNLKGYLVGNGVTNWKYDTTPAYLEMGYWHGLYDTEMYQSLKDNQCDFSNAQWNTNITDTCNALMDRFNDLTSQINIYDIYGICYATGSKSDQFTLYSSSDMGLSKVGNEIKPYKKSYSAADYTPFLYKGKHAKKMLRDLPPCTFGNPIIEYLNSAAVRQALHIPANVQAWDLCTSSIGYTESVKGSQWVYEELKGIYKILFYSGDTDGAVPTYGSIQWINEMNWTIKEQWRPYMVDGQVGGYIEERDGMTFGTVHGAGHMAPQFKPAQTYHLIFNWLQGKAI